MRLPGFIFTLRLTLFIAPQCLVCASASGNSTSSWAKLQISPDILGSMPYGYFRVSIYEHSINHKSNTLPNQKRYYYDPIALLDHKSAISDFNNVTKTYEMRFKVEMWNDQVQNQVVNYLPQIVGHEIYPYQVQIIAFEQVLLASKRASTSYSLSTEWHPYKLEKFLLFTLTCFQQNDCNQLKENMHNDPAGFNNFKLLLSLASQTSQTRETFIRLENAVSGEMVNSLLQKFSEGTDPLLTAEDQNRLLSEMSTSVMLETFDDSDIVSTQSETHIYNTIKDMMVSSKVTISKLSDEVWTSVFWNNDNYRPDKTSKQLNEIYNRQEKETQRKMADAFKKSNVAGFNVGSEGFSLGTTIDLSREGSSTKEDLDRLQQESKDHVEWDGERFVPKPMVLSRINLGRLRDTHKVQDRRVTVRYSTAVLFTPIHFTQLNDVTNSNELIELRSMVELMKDKINFLELNLLDTEGKVVALKEEITASGSFTKAQMDDAKNEIAVVRQEISAIPKDVKEVVIFDAYRRKIFTLRGDSYGRRYGYGSNENNIVNYDGVKEVEWTSVLASSRYQLLESIRASSMD